MSQKGGGAIIREGAYYKTDFQTGSLSKRGLIAGGGGGINRAFTVYHVRQRVKRICMLISFAL